MSTPVSGPVRVTLVTHYFPAHRGGVEAVAWQLASRLAASGAARITWYASDTDAPPADRPGLRCVPARSCNALERRLGIPYPLWSPAALLALVREVRASDAVHLHDFLYPANLVAWAAARLSRRAVIVTQHVGMIPYRNGVLRVLLATANWAFGKLVLGSAAQTLFVSEAVLAYFHRFVRFRSQPLRMPNGVDAHFFFPVDDAHRRALRAELGVEAGVPLLLFVGRFVEKKGMRLLQKLAPLVPGAQWIFVGRGPLDPSAWQLKNVRVRHDLSQDALVPLYQAADLLVLPSVGEGFPLVVQEAMACGTPALVSEETAAGSPEADALLLREPLGKSDDEARWSARIRALLSSPDLADLRHGVAEFARSRWSWERCAERYAEIMRCASP